MAVRTVMISRLGAKGDGIADTCEGPVFVPFCLPGETVEITGEGSNARLLSLKSASQQRVKPACSHFGICGGCSLQHFELNAYREWKRQTVIASLQARGIEVMVEEILVGKNSGRRRTVFAVGGQGRNLRLGFYRPQSHEIFDATMCVVAVPQIAERLDELRKLARIVKSRPSRGRMQVTSSNEGLDIAIYGCGVVGEDARTRAIDWVRQQSFARLAVDGDIVVEMRAPLIRFGNALVAPPPGAFLQASPVAELQIYELIAAHFFGTRKVADLFCGCGTFALRLAENFNVHAVENNADLLDALLRATRGTTGLKPVSAERRDLYRRPISARELNKYDAVLFDPPRAGAQAQTIELAGSSVSRVAAVSCNSATLARDLRILVDGGYHLDRVVPVDQFQWTSHCEVVALLSRR